MRKVDINVENVSMRFRVPNKRIDSLKEYILGIIKNNIKYKEFYALDSINFKIYSGERIGIIGHNGAGKSTLLKIISGIIKPTNGKVEVDGMIAPLLELGAGFDQELSGEENIYLNGAVLGKSKDFLESKYDEILDFSGLEKFIHSPVKNYSSGMKARLGFSIATQVNPDILIVDEILGVGDEKFKKKSSKKMTEMMNSGKTVILVSHSINKIKRLTDKTIWLDKGKIKAFGETETICNMYLDAMNK